MDYKQFWTTSSSKFKPVESLVDQRWRREREKMCYCDSALVVARSLFSHQLGLDIQGITCEYPNRQN